MIPKLIRKTEKIIPSPAIREKKIPKGETARKKAVNKETFSFFVDIFAIRYQIRINRLPEKALINLVLKILKPINFITMALK